MKLNATISSAFLSWAWVKGFRKLKLLQHFRFFCGRGLSSFSRTIILDCWSLSNPLSFAFSCVETLRGLKEITKGEPEQKMIVLYRCCALEEKLCFSAVQFFRTKGSVVEVNSVIMDTCFEFSISLCGWRKEADKVVATNEAVLTFLRNNRMPRPLFSPLYTWISVRLCRVTRHSDFRHIFCAET